MLRLRQSRRWRETRDHRIVSSVRINYPQNKLSQAASLEKANKYQPLFPLPHLSDIN